MVEDELDPPLVGLLSYDRKGIAGHISEVILGLILIMLAAPIQWFNEERTARSEALMLKGLEEVISVDASFVSKANRGRLVHVQGRARGTIPLADTQFEGATVVNCVKLQSTVEVFQWVQNSRSLLDSKERRSHPRFHTEWCTSQVDSLKFRKPSPDNPRPPKGLFLGTFTHLCDRVELGAFSLPEGMLHAFHRLEPVADRLPPKLTAQGLPFFNSHQDGYYYARQGVLDLDTAETVQLFKRQEVGDLRVRFMCVPETDCTVVAVQRHLGHVETFVPYRAVKCNPCTEAHQARQSLIEEGDRSLKELRNDRSCCTGGVAGCCCCACNTIACLCAGEVLTEEICYVSDRLEPPERPFEWAVSRSTWRQWTYRLLGVALLFGGLRLSLSPVAERLETAPGLKVYGSAAAVVLAVALSLAISALVAAAVTAFYRPLGAIRWVLAAAACLGAPLVMGGAR